MHILLTNDDGIYSEGLHILYGRLRQLGKVSVVAPEREMSATGHGITMHKPLRVNEVGLHGSNETGLAVSGTPTDCVKLALEVLLPNPPDMIISGINWGANVGTDILYSGTVSAAIEGTISGFKSIAVSLDIRSENPNFSSAADFILKLINIYHQQDISQNTLLNVNIPDIEDSHFKGFKATKLGQRKYIDAIEKRKDPRGKDYYWLAGHIEDNDKEPDSDINALKKNMISVCPVHFDLTQYEAIEVIRKWPLNS